MSPDLPPPNSFGARSTQRIIYITLEYCKQDLFSGNGICARSQVRGLSTLLYDDNSGRNGIQLLMQEVIVARPASAASNPLDPSDTPPGVRLHVVPVSNWKTTDLEFDHETFAVGVQSIVMSLISKDDTTLPPISAILAVDWTGMAGVSKALHGIPKTIRIFFLNFRVYASMTNISQEHRHYYQTVEEEAVRVALESGGAVMALSAADTESLKAMLMTKASENTKYMLHDYSRQCLLFRTIWPMLRNEFAEIAQQAQDSILDTTRHRPYFACIVRLAQDKGPQRFVQICQAITRRDPDFWTRTQTIPLLAGAASQPALAKTIQQDLEACIPQAVIVKDFLGPNELSQLLLQTRLNLHPALYEAFGMTIVEAAACGAPTLLNQNGTIGAEQLLPIHKGCSLGVDMENEAALTHRVMELLEMDPAMLAAVGRQAYHVAVSWTELAHVGALWEMVQELSNLQAGKDGANPLPN